jgi:hypothetical protein
MAVVGRRTTPSVSVVRSGRHAGLCLHPPAAALRRSAAVIAVR